MSEVKGKPDAPPPGSAPANLSPGMATLLRMEAGEVSDKEPPPSNQAQPGPVPVLATEAQCETMPGRPPSGAASSDTGVRAPKTASLRALLLLGDLFLMALVCYLVFTHKGRMNFAETVLVAGAVVVGAGLGCWAFWLD
jgi:hypothetical protein